MDTTPTHKADQKPSEELRAKILHVVDENQGATSWGDFIAALVPPYEEGDVLLELLALTDAGTLRTSGTHKHDWEYRRAARPATNIKELPALLAGIPVGTELKIKGYVDSAGTTKDLHVKTLGPDDYAEMKQESLKILEETKAPELPGFPPTLVAQARDALMASYRVTPSENAKARAFKDPYVEAEKGGYSTKPDEEAIYLLRLRDMSPKSLASSDFRVDLVRAKAALVRSLDLPAGRYMHAVKLRDGGFESVEKVQLPLGVVPR